MFSRQDERDDRYFYSVPRFETHIDPETIAALSEFYAEALADGDRVLDLMSSWVSHLPPVKRFECVIGLGMNVEELARNDRLDGAVVQDLNIVQELPFRQASFDAVLVAVSVQYLVRPVPVFASIARVLKPGGQCHIAFSHRLFPEKAIRAWLLLPHAQKAQLIASYFTATGNFEPAVAVDRSPGGGADPLWIVSARRSPESNP